MLREKFWVHTLIKGHCIGTLFYAKEPYPQLGISVELQRKHIIPSLPSLTISQLAVYYNAWSFNCNIQFSNLFYNFKKIILYKFAISTIRLWTPWGQEPHLTLLWFPYSIAQNFAQSDYTIYSFIAFLVNKDPNSPTNKLERKIM